MEIWIIGALFVALMVYVSTRIKRAAATAFEPESVEKEDFRIEKPIGFLFPVNAETEFAFECYSKTYGERGTRNIWRARTRLRVSEGLNTRQIVDELKKGGEVLVSEKKMDDLPRDQMGSIVKSEKEVDEIGYTVLRKIVGDKTNNKTYELRTTILHPFQEEFTDIACEMMRSFEVRSAGAK